MLAVPQIICLVLSAITVAVMPYYCKINYEGKSKVTLILKMILSAFFVATAAIALGTGPNHRPFAIIMMIGFIASFIGDFLLGISERMVYFVIGALFFFGAHVLYIISFSKLAGYLTPNVPWFNGFEISLYVAMAAGLGLLFLITKPKFHKIFVLMIFYFAGLMLMVTKTFGVGLRLFDRNPAMLLLPIGAIIFLYSDLTLGMMRFKMAKRSAWLKMSCTATYFVAQMCLAWSLFVTTQF